MVRELRRLLIERERLVAGDPSQLCLSADERHYLERVLRYGPGERFSVVDGAGHGWTARLQSGGVAELEQPLAAPLQVQTQPRPNLVLVAAVVKRDFEVVVRMAVELGVDRLIPVLSDRTAVQGQLRPDRWRSIAVEAAEQCERLWLPRIEAPVALADLLSAGAPQSPTRRDPLPGAVLRLWCTTRTQELPPLLESLPAAGEEPRELWLACGPEGGWSPSEDHLAQGCGWRAVQLGPRILRSSTACVAALAALSLWRGVRCGC